VQRGSIVACKMRWGSHATSSGLVIEMTDRACLVLWDDGKLTLSHASSLQELNELEDAFRVRNK
jgi:hypothetical protein